MTDEDREERARRLASEQSQRASDLAYKQGKREANVDAILEAHETRLNAINGSIDRGAARTTELTRAVDHLRDEVRALTAIGQTKEAVDRALHAEIRTANESQISRRMFLVAVIGVMISMCGVIVTVLVSVGSH